MDETTLIENLLSYVDSSLSAPVRTGQMEDERPVPVVILEDWSSRDLNLNNGSFEGEVLEDTDNDGDKELTRVHRFDYKTRVDFVVRHTDQVSASELSDQLQVALKEAQIDPSLVHSDLKSVRPRDSGNPQFEFTEQKESEFNYSAELWADHTITRSEADGDFDTIESLDDSFTVTQ